MHPRAVFGLVGIAMMGAGAFVACTTHAQTTALCNGSCLLTGGEKGDYYLHFGPPVQRLLKKAWEDVPIATSPGAPASLAWVVEHPTSYALVQGDVLARSLKDPAVASKIKVLRSSGIGDEAVIAVASDWVWDRSGGSWLVVTRHAAQGKLTTAARDSGPGATMQSLQALDPDGLGKGAVDYSRSMDDAITAVGTGIRGVALMVQFANPDNPRFKAIADAKLHVMPVVMSQMRALQFPDGTGAYRICEGVQTGVGPAIDTACTPIQLITGASNDNPDLAKVFAGAIDADFVPREAGLRNSGNRSSPRRLVRHRQRSMRHLSWRRRFRIGCNIAQSEEGPESRTLNDPFLIGCPMHCAGWREAETIRL